MSCLVPENQGAARAGLLGTDGGFCTSLIFSLAFCAFLQFLFMLTYFLTQNGQEKVVSYSFFRLCRSSVCYLIKVHLGSFISQILCFPVNLGAAQFTCPKL